MLTKENFTTNPNKCFLCSGAAKEWLARGTDYEYATTDMEFDFYLCKSCSLIFIDPIPDESMMSIIYPPNYYAYQTMKYNRFIKYMRSRQLDGKVKKFLKKSEKISNLCGLKVLEIGCGVGDLLLAFKRFSPQISLTGIDYSSESIDQVKALGFTAHQGDICKLDLGKEKFDLIICQQLIEHLHNPSALLDRIKSWLRPSGVLILETPGVVSIDRMIFKGCWGGYHIPRHMFLFSERSMDIMLQKHGFRINEIFYDFCLAFWVWSIHNLIVKYTHQRKIADIFSLKNPLAILPFWIFEHIRMSFMKTASMGIVCYLK